MPSYVVVLTPQLAEIFNAKAASPERAAVENAAGSYGLALAPLFPNRKEPAAGYFFNLVVHGESGPCASIDETTGCKAMKALRGLPGVECAYEKPDARPS